MEIGTHNSMTYLPIKKWYMKPFKWIARCQNLTIEEQFEKGIRLFDIRIAYDNYYYPEFKHGLISYKGKVYKYLKWLNEQNVPIKIRLILEITSKDSTAEELFQIDFKEIQKQYPNLIFYEGRRKYDWQQLLDLPTLEPLQLVSSMDNKWYNDLLPILYAKKHNKKNLEKYKDYKDPILLDFIDK